MTCLFFVWGRPGGIDMRNLVCNCIGSFGLRNESKVRDDQTVNRLLAATQLKVLAGTLQEHLSLLKVLLQNLSLSCHENCSPSCKNPSLCHSMDPHVVETQVLVSFVQRSESLFTASKTVPKVDLIRRQTNQRVKHKSSVRKNAS